MEELTLPNIKSFLESTRDVVYLREDDKLLIIRPNKIHHINDTAFDMLYGLYNRGNTVDEVLENLEKKYGMPKDRLREDLVLLLNNINSLMNENYGGACMTREIEFDPGSIKYPILSEIALTYRCQNRCDFCYASSPYRGELCKEMSTDEVKTVIEKISVEAKVPTISFTGGEPTLRNDLPELVRYASGLGIRTNLITNGIRCHDGEFVKSLARAGLKSAQVSLESHDEKIHNSITGNDDSFKKVVWGIKNLKNSGIYTHTNSTICQKNRDHLIPLVQFIKDEFDFPYLSMNMIIKTGIAKDNENIDISYSSIESILKPVIDYSEIIGIKLVWYSPTPYCIFNPVDFNLGSKSCACITGLVSVNPRGDILPCSSYDRGVGNLLKHSFNHIWNSDQALYFREKRYLPPVCNNCKYDILCGGACPLYWENAGSFNEIEKKNQKNPKFKNLMWQIENRLRVKSKGTKGIGV